MSEYLPGLFGAGGVLLGALIGLGGVVVQTRTAMAVERRSGLRTLYVGFLEAHQNHLLVHRRWSPIREDLDEFLVSKFGKPLDDFDSDLAFESALDELDKDDREKFESLNEKWASMDEQWDVTYLALSHLNRQIQIQGPSDVRRVAWALISIHSPEHPDRSRLVETFEIAARWDSAYRRSERRDAKGELRFALRGPWFQEAADRARDALWGPEANARYKAG